jgi:hypothetical protein
MPDTDFRSNLPVMTEVDADSKVQIKIMDYADPTGTNKQAAVSDGNVHVYGHGKNPSGGEEIVLLSELGATAVDGIYDATNNTNPSNIGVIAHARGATPGNADQTKRLTSVTSGTATSLDVSLHDHAGAAYGPSNPLYVNVTNGATGAEVFTYHEFADVAANGTASWSLSATSGNVLSLQKLLISGSGAFKAVVAIGTTLSETTRMVLFNSTAQPVQQYEFALPQSVAATESIKITVTNRDKSTQSIYATIEGVENAAP